MKFSKWFGKLAQPIRSAFWNCLIVIVGALVLVNEGKLTLEQLKPTVIGAILAFTLSVINYYNSKK